MLNPYTGRRSGELLELRLTELTHHIQTVLVGRPEIAAAYLFGSAVSFVRPQSDIDIALITGQPVSPAFMLEGTIEEKLGRFGPHVFHVTVLTEDKVNFAFHVLTRGQVVFVADRPQLTEFIERISTIHRDHERFLEVYEQARGRTLRA